LHAFISNWLYSLKVMREKYTAAKLENIMKIKLTYSKEKKENSLLAN